MDESSAVEDDVAALFPKLDTSSPKMSQRSSDESDQEEIGNSSPKGSEDQENNLQEITFDEDSVKNDENDSFWKEHEEWKKSVLENEELNDVKIKNPEKLGRNSFDEKLEENDMFQNLKIKRRYSDFLFLSNNLRQRFVGMLIPPLPPKILTPNPSKQQITCRMKGLNLFLQKLISNPYLKSDLVVLSFLTENSEIWEMTKKQLETKTASNRDNIGLLKWMQALSAYPLPKDAKSPLLKLTKEVIVLQQRLKLLLAGSEALSASASVYATATQDFRDKITELLPKKMLSDEGEEQKDELLGCLENLATDCLKFEEFGVKNANMMVLWFQESVRFELGLVSSLKQVLKQRQSIIKLHEKSTQQRMKHEREKFGLERSGQVEKAQKVEEKIEKDKQNVTHTYEHAMFITKGLFFSRIDQFADVKQQRIEHLRKSLAQQMSQFHAATSSSWISTQTSPSTSP